MHIITPTTPNWIAKTVDCLQNGNIVIHPTDTAYGIAVDATNPTAINKVFELKKRQGKPLIMIVQNQQQANNYVELNPTAEILMQHFWPGALTLVLPKRENVPEELTRGIGKVGIRQPNHPITAVISQSFNKPYTSTSANLSGGPTPYSIQEALDQLDHHLIDIVIDFGPLPEKPTSTVVDLTETDPKILREGAIGLNQILSVI